MSWNLRHDNTILLDLDWSCYIVQPYFLLKIYLSNAKFNKWNNDYLEQLRAHFIKGKNASRGKSSRNISVCGHAADSRAAVSVFVLWLFIPRDIAEQPKSPRWDSRSPAALVCARTRGSERQSERERENLMKARPIILRPAYIYRTVAHTTGAAMRLYVSTLYVYYSGACAREKS